MESFALLVFGSWGLILEVARDSRGAHSLCEQGQHFDRACDVADPRGNDLPWVDVAGGFGVVAVDFDMSGLTSRTGLRSGPIKTNRPQPFVETDLGIRGGGAHRRGVAQFFAPGNRGMGSRTHLAEQVSAV